MMRALFMLVVVAGAVSACTPPDVAYCRDRGVSPMDLDACVADYRQQEAAFNADLAVCSVEADVTYPPTLYSGWGQARVHGGIGHGGYWHSAETVSIPPDYNKNAQLDALRLRIIEPCMQKRGWNSGTSWQDGRRNPSLGQMDPNGGGLPWATAPR